MKTQARLYISRLLLARLLFTLACLPMQVLAEVSRQDSASRVEPLSIMSMLNMVMGLVVVVALILGLAWVLRKYGRLPTTNQVDMKILGGLSLGTRERAVLIEVQGERLLIGVAPGRVEKLHVMQQPPEGFEQSLSKAMDEHS